MPTNAPITFSFAGLPGGSAYCFTTPSQFANDITNGLSGYLPGEFAKIINSNSEPSVEDRIDSLWFKTNEGRLFYYDGGWISPNPIMALADERRIFVGIESDVWSYDGGDGVNPSVVAPTSSTGAMWEVDHNFDFRFPIGAGTSPAPNNTVINVGDTGGEEKHLLTPSEIPDLTGQSNALGPYDATGSEIIYGGDAQRAHLRAKINSLAGIGTFGLSHNNMPPYRGVFFIKRTSRIFFTA